MTKISPVANPEYPLGGGGGGGGSNKMWPYGTLGRFVIIHIFQNMGGGRF